MYKYFIPIIIGSTRKESRSRQAAQLMQKIATVHFENIEVKTVDPNDYPLDYDGDSNEEYSKLTKIADGFIIVSPEYNHGYPGRLKSLLDSEFDNYRNKPVLICGVSSGYFGGSRVVENLIPVLRSFQMLILSHSIYFSNAKDNFEDYGNEFNERICSGIYELINLLELTSIVERKARDDFRTY